MGRASWMLFAMMVTALMSIQPVSAAALTSTITDPTGDAFEWGTSVPAPGYQDIVGATVALKDGRFALALNVAESIPSSPALPPGKKLLEWSWEFDTNPMTNPAGFPFTPSTSPPTEYIVQILWDGTNFKGQLIDRTPLVAGGDAVVTPLSFSVKGAEFRTSLEATMIGAPSSFRWISITRTWASDLGSLGWFPIDGAPDRSIGPATWPS